jgi:hypothetical protein
MNKFVEGIMKTGADVIYPGVYGSECCLVEEELEDGASFPRCPRCMNLTLWFEVSVQLDTLDRKAA